MARQSNAALRTLLRMQATREKQMAETHPAAMERAGYWFRDISVPAPEPEPAPPPPPPPARPARPIRSPRPSATPCIYPDRAARIRAAGGLLRRLTSAHPSPTWSTRSSTAPARSCWRWTATGTTAPRNQHKTPFLRQRLTNRHFETMVSYRPRTGRSAREAPASGTRCDRNTSAQARQE